MTQQKQATVRPVRPQTKTLTISTYDFLSVVCKELQISSVTVNCLSRIAYALFPNKITRINPNFIPNLWVNKILAQLPDKSIGVIDADLWHSIYYYLVNFSGVDKEFYQYDTSIPFETWFTKVVADTPNLTINNSKTWDDIPQELTKDYVDISNRILISMYILDSFGSRPRMGMRREREVQNVSSTEIEPPTLN